jgi:adenylate kinase
MYEEAPDVPPGRILNVELLRLQTTRRSVDRRILEQVRGSGDSIVLNSHAVFRAQHGLIYPGGSELLAEFGQGMYITIIDDADSVYIEMRRRYPWWTTTLKDILVWREEEILCTEMLANIARPRLPHYVVARKHPVSVIHDLIFNPGKRKAYVSFPITQIESMPEIKEQVRQFRQQVAAALVTFDPLTIAERSLIAQAMNAPSPETRIAIGPEGYKIEFSAQELLALKSDIDSQIVARDFKLIDQSDMVVAFVPKLPTGRMEVSAGVTMEIQHAFGTGREVFIICPAPNERSCSRARLSTPFGPHSVGRKNSAFDLARSSGTQGWSSAGGGAVRSTPRTSVTATTCRASLALDCRASDRTTCGTLTRRIWSLPAWTPAPWPTGSGTPRRRSP